MISKQEIMNLSREFSLAANIIEKDYVLGWILAGIANMPALITKWAFKGGTCLKKCYFETYRLSEDLDYTLTDVKHLDAFSLVSRFKQIAAWVYDESGIKIPDEKIRFEIYQNNAGKTSAEGSLYYTGPLQRRDNQARIKLDLTADEKIVMPLVSREAHHPYSDKPLTGIKTSCYSFSEIFAEKIRALSERLRPRDLYDVIHLYRHRHDTAPYIAPTLVLNILTAKCMYKKIPVPKMNHIENHPRFNELKSEWSNMLAHQLPKLPPWEEFWQELPMLFQWLYGESGARVLKKIPLPNKTIDQTWQPSSMIHAWNAPVPLELIRFAGANHLCIELGYDNKTRLIEPYDLQKTNEGNLLLIAIKHRTGEWRSYRIDRIQNITVSSISFIPRYAISLTPFSGLRTSELKTKRKNTDRKLVLT